MPLNIIYVMLHTIVYDDGGGKNCVMAMILQFVANFFAFIVLGREFGVFGIALGTVIGYLPPLFIIFKWVFFDSQTLKPILYFSPAESIKILKLSYVRASLCLYLGFGNMILNAFFLEMFGDKYFPVLSLIFSVMELSLFLDGIGQAAEPLINIYLGENNFYRIKKVMKLATITAFLLGAATIPIIFIFSESIIEIFRIDKEIFAESMLAIRIFAFAMPFLSLLYRFVTYYQILGHMILALALSFCKDFAFYIALPVIFSFALGINGFWLGMLSVSMITCAVFIIFLLIRHKKDFPLLLPTKDIVSWDAKLNLEKVLELRDRAEAEFLKRGFNNKISMRAALIVEEIGMSIVDNNPNASPLAEMTIFFDEQPKIIIRDNGLHFDLTDEAVKSFRSFFTYSFLEGSQIDNNYLTTQNYNRHIFSLKNDSGSF